MSKNTALVTWLVNQVQYDETGTVFFRELLKESRATGRKQLYTLLRRLYPLARMKKKRDRSGKSVTAYIGISMKDKENVAPQDTTTTGLNGLEGFIPADAILLPSSPDKLRVGIASAMSVNGNMLVKTVEFEEGRWELYVRDKMVNLQKLDIDGKFVCNEANFLNVVSLVRKMTICRGTLISRAGKMQHMPYFYVESVKDGPSAESVTRLRSHYCHQIPPWGSTTGVCRACQCLPNFLKEDSIELNEDDNRDLSHILSECFGDASPEMKELLKAQHDALAAKTPQSRRWPKSVISVCLSLWLRSPQAYRDLQASHVLILPSGRHLARYKNAIPQASGIQDSMLHWMYRAANDANVTLEGRAGILIHDETKIQDDLVLNFKDGKPHLVGWMDSGAEGNLMRTLREGTVQQKLASEVLQLYFLGYTGFRWPVCHFPTCGIKSSELYTIVWETIARLQDWDFTVDCVLQDGGAANRYFIRSQFSGSPSDSKFLTTNVVNPTKSIGMCQDFSHAMKKIRNGIIKSGGNASFHTRKLLLGGRYIVWKHWVSAVEWDRTTNSRPIHYKVSNAHLFPDKSEKMRNHLAEEMLDSDALNLMKHYRASLHDGAALDSSIQLLEVTSQMIRIFRSRMPINNMEDERFAVLRDCLRWFQGWKSAALENADIPQKERSKSILSSECCEDVESLLLCFPEVCRIHLDEFPTGSVVPSRFNTDLIENHFCQQRGLHNGNTTNPSYSTYCSTTNSIILGQSLSSRGRKSNAGIIAAKPFNFYVGQPLCKRRK